MSDSSDIKHFEKNLLELEELVEALESGELSLEDSLAHFEKGIKMTKSCQEALSSAEQRVRILLEQEDGELQLEGFPAENAQE